MAAGHQNPSAYSGFYYPVGHHASLLWSDHQAPASHPWRVSAATSHESDCVRGLCLPALLDTVPHCSDGRYIFQDKDCAVPVPCKDGGGPGHVCYPESGPASQLCQPGAVCFCGREVQKKAVSDNEEGGRHGESDSVTDQQVFTVIRNYIHINVRDT